MIAHVAILPPLEFTLQLAPFERASQIACRGLLLLRFFGAPVDNQQEDAAGSGRTGRRSAWLVDPGRRQPMMSQEVMEYRVELDAYSGPLDLLLYLVRRHEVDVLNLPIADITARFVEFLEILHVLDLDLIGDFVVMASSLIEIKSRMALPEPDQPPELVEPDEDPRADLVRQLREYKRFKDAARLLEEQAAQWQQRYPRLSDDRPRGANDPSRDLIKEVELWDLLSALSRVLRKNTESAPATIIYDDTPIAVYMEQIKSRVLAEQRVEFSSFFAGSNSRSRIVGIFLALLELLRHEHFRAEQPQEYHEIWILPPA